jgi:hypothetical protein
VGARDKHGHDGRQRCASNRIKRQTGNQPAKTNRALGMSATQHPQRPSASERYDIRFRKGFPSSRIAPNPSHTGLCLGNESQPTALQSVFERSMSSGLTRGWIPVRMKKTRQTKSQSPASDSIRSGKAQSSAGSSPSASRSGLPTRICSAIRPEFCRIAISILAVRSGLARKNAFAFSRPCPMRWLS